MKTLRGLAVSLNTPFDEQDRIDWKSLEKTVEMHLREGAAGFLVPAQAAEVHYLSLDERLALVRAVREQTRNRAIVIAGATASDGVETLKLAEAAGRLGCEWVLSEPPPEATGETAHLVEFFGRIAAAGPPLLMIQDLDWGGSGMPIPLILELLERVERFRALKVEVNPAGPKYTAVLEAAGGRLEVTGGWAALQMIEALDRGVELFMNTAFTRAYRGVMDAYFRGDRELAKERFYRLLPILAFTRQHLDVSILFHKRHFHRIGVFSTARTRKPCEIWDRFHSMQSDEMIAYANQLQAESADWR